MLSLSPHHRGPTGCQTPESQCCQNFHLQDSTGTVVLGQNLEKIYIYCLFLTTTTIYNWIYYFNAQFSKLSLCKKKNKKHLLPFKNLFKQLVLVLFFGYELTTSLMCWLVTQFLTFSKNGNSCSSIAASSTGPNVVNPLCTWNMYSKNKQTKNPGSFFCCCCYKQCLCGI